MTSSALDTNDAVNSAIESLTLPAACTAKLSPSQIENMKTNVVFANQAMETAGSAIKATAECLHLIKADVKNKNWTALTESGALNMSGRMARDLVKAYETWLEDTDIPDSALARVSPRVLAKIGKADAGQRVHAVNKIKKGGGFTEADLSTIIKKPGSAGTERINTKKLLDEKSLTTLLEKAGVSATKTQVKQIKASAASLAIEAMEEYNEQETMKLTNALMKQRQLNGDLLRQIKTLTKENGNLKNLLNQAALEGVAPLVERMEAAAK